MHAPHRAIHAPDHAGLLSKEKLLAGNIMPGFSVDGDDVAGVVMGE